MSATQALSSVLGGDPASWPAGKPSSLVASLRQTKPQPLTRAERIRRFGVDCGDGLTWAAGWQPGGEYTKQLVVKNVSKNMVRLKYKLPESKFFSMAFPEVIQLNAGLSTVLQIHFRPIHLEEYDDCIEFTTEKGTFVVPIRAAIPRISSHVPSNLDFGFCPVLETATSTFHISNDGEVPVTYTWDVPAPFTLTPSSGSIAPGGASLMTASFSPTDASVSVASCICHVAGHTSHVLKMGGIGKYPFLAATTERVDHGKVLTGGTSTQHLKLRNTSLVYARFQIVRTSRDVEPVFAFSPMHGIIPPDGELTIAQTYTPKVTGTFTSDAYEVRTPGGNTVPIECVGEAVGPEVSLSKDVLNFGDVVIELPAKSSSRLLEVHNHSDAPVPYQLFGVETNGLFQLNHASGVLLPRQPSYIKFSFSPNEPGNYYKRIYILLLNAAPLAVDLIGSGYNDKRRPLPIQPRFVAEYIAREARGLHRLSPEELQSRADARQSLLASGEPPDSYDDELTPTEIEASTLTASLDPTSELALMHSLFRGSAWRGGAVYLEEEYVDFGNGSRLRASEPKTIRLTNNTSGKLAVQWVVPHGYVNGSPKDQSTPVFAISPASVDVQPHSTAAFKLQFRPQSDQQYYVQSIECVCSFKSMRTFRLVSESNFALPWTLSLTATGDSFPPQSEQFIPRGLLSHGLLTFPAVHVGDSCYQTIAIQNDNDTPMLFSIRTDLGAAFTIAPPVGLVPSGKTQLLAVRFAPAEATRYTRTASIVLNNDPSAALSLSLVGIGARASLEMPTKLFAPTACVGASSHARMRVTNPSRLPLAFEWDVPDKYASLLAVSQPYGVLKGKETIELEWAFSPTAERNYLIKVPCRVSALEEGSQESLVRQTLTVSGVGSTGAIQADPVHLQYGTVLVGATHRRTLTLINSSAVDLYYSLSFTLESRTGDAAGGPTVAELLTCDAAEGLVPARNTVDVHLLLSPPRREEVTFAVSCTLRPGASHGLGGGPVSGDRAPGTPGALLGPPRQLCRVSASADYPLLQVVDARLAGVPQELLWQQLRVPELNGELADVLSDAEQRLLSSEGLASAGDVASMASSLPAVDMMLPPGLPGEAPSQLHLLLRNTGELSTSFQVRYPTEMELQIEHWADKGEPSPVELKHHLIVDKGIMSVAPRSAELQPGEEVEVVVRMRHFRADDYELPLLLQIASGRQIVLNVIGHTMALGERYLHIPLREIPLPPTPIGLPVAQRHTFELPNYGNVDLPFEVVLSHLHRVNQANHGFPVLICEDPSGVIPPGGVAHVRVRFHPLEVKDYHVALPVSLGSAGVSTFVLLASGYHPNEPTEYRKFLQHQQTLLPPAQQLLPPYQPMRLSFDRALFGQVPMGATVRRLVVLRNAYDVPCDFAWDTRHPLWGTLLSIYPSHGTLAPGKHMCCKLSLVAVGPPEELRTSLACHLHPHVDLELSESALLSQQAAHLSGNLQLLPPTHPLAPGTAMRPRSPARQSVAEHRPKLRGLQALLHIEERESRRQAAAAGLSAAEYATTAAITSRNMPTPPPSQMAAAASASGSAGSTAPPKLLLDVRACISPPEVLVAGGVDLSSFYLPRSAPPTEEPPLPSLGVGTSAPHSLPGPVQEQREACEAIAMQMLSEVLKDASVTRAIATLDMEAPPLFEAIAHAHGARPEGGGDAARAQGMSSASDAPPPPGAAADGEGAADGGGRGEGGASGGGGAAYGGAVGGGGGSVVAAAEAPAATLLSEDDDEAALEANYQTMLAQRRAAEAERKRLESEANERVRSASEFQSLVAYVLEGTLFNLVSEVSLGEFSLETVPRQIVRSLEITQTIDADEEEGGGREA